MNQVLYRKYRPSSFDEVVGQDHIVEVLKRVIESGNVSHAYLFSGSRGLGKTTVARLLAGGLGVKEKDLYEIDAASNRGIDDIRELREAVGALPFESPYKVYIVDEAHMLTKEAANALLKTLEEPPAHAVFVLATTEAHKLPETIVSRCEVHQFKKPSIGNLELVIEKTATEEGYEIEPAGVSLIAELGDRSYRDMLGVLQKVLHSAPNKTISVEHIEKVTGAPPRELLNDVIEAIDGNDLEKGFAAVMRAVEENIDMTVFANLLLSRIRTILLIRFAPEMREEFKEERGEDDYQYLYSHATKKESRINAEVLSVLLSASGDIKYASLQNLPIELALMRIVDKSDS